MEDDSGLHRIHPDDLAGVKAKDLAVGRSPSGGEGLFTRVALRCGEVVLEERPTLYAPTRGKFTTRPWNLTDQAFATERHKLWYTTEAQDVETLRRQCGWDEEDEAQARALSDLYKVSYDRVVVVYSYLCRVNINTLTRGAGLYHFLNRVNHACSANAKLFDGDLNGLKKLVALRDIRAGEEVTFCYTFAEVRGPDGFTTPARREHLSSVYGFVCACTACKANITLSRLGEPPDFSLVEHLMPAKPDDAMRFALFSAKDGHDFQVDVFADPSKEPLVYMTTDGFKRVPYTPEMKRQLEKLMMTSESYRKFQRKALQAVGAAECQMCHEKERPLKLCGRCRLVRYCSPECQRQDWSIHRVSCHK
jgi:hypothetical protein